MVRLDHWTKNRPTGDDALMLHTEYPFILLIPALSDLVMGLGTFKNWPAGSRAAFCNQFLTRHSAQSWMMTHENCAGTYAPQSL